MKVAATLGFSAEVFVYPNMGDGGLCFGAAALAAADSSQQVSSPMLGCAHVSLSAASTRTRYERLSCAGLELDDRLCLRKGSVFLGPDYVAETLGLLFRGHVLRYFRRARDAVRFCVDLKGLTEFCDLFCQQVPR